MDLGELRKNVLALLEWGRVDIPWDHILAEGHEVSDEEIQATLGRGTYEFHEVVDGRYLATYWERPSPVAILVLFELRELEGAGYIQVITAFHIRAPRGRPRRRR